MDILSRIVIDKRREVALKQQLFPVNSLEQSPLFERPTHSVTALLKSKGWGLIAEYKRRSPSKTVINQSHSVEDVAQGYEHAGVCGMSVLTDGKYFGGSLDDLVLARASCNLPLLRKEFIIDPYQIIEAKAYGADVILLIAAILSPKELKTLSELAQSLSLEVLLEVHDETELQASIMPSLNLIGVNNRNLKTFEVSLETSKRLSSKIPNDFIKVSESGISEVSAVKSLREYGYQGFLIGEHFMKTENPGKSAQTFINAAL